MSLNHREIDRVLEELGLAGSRIDRINQPDRFSLYLETYRPGFKGKILIGLHPGSVRISSVASRPALPHQPPRFAQLLRSRLGGGRIRSVEQPFGERHVVFTIERGEGVYLLWVRMWSGNPNMILTDGNSKIIDVLFRKPESGESAGRLFTPDLESLSRKGSGIERTVRDFSGFPDFNSFVDHRYNIGAETEKKERERAAFLKSLDREIKSLGGRIEKLRERERLYSSFEDEKMKGELIRGNLHRIRKGDTLLEALSYSGEESIAIPLKKELSPVENCEAYFKKFRKYKKGHESVIAEIDSLKGSLSDLIEKKERISEGVETLPEAENRGTDLKGKGSPLPKSGPGLLFHSGPFEILVGRNSRENDELLRRKVRGNDIWLHVRQNPGGFVFIKTIKGKTVPLDTLLDAANLALLYSSLPKGTGGDVHYTEAKHIRRRKGGAPGQVTVEKDKNLFVKYDRERIARLQGKGSLERKTGKKDN